MRLLVQLPGCPFQSTHPVRGGTKLTGTVIPALIISIHPPREGWDGFDKTYSTIQADFNPPTP